MFFKNNMFSILKFLIVKYIYTKESAMVAARWPDMTAAAWLTLLLSAWVSLPLFLQILPKS